MQRQTEKRASAPWVEKYRPTQFDQIVIEPHNRAILQNILATGYFPNLLLYGPPGTGKTTTIINLIHAYQARYFSGKNNDLIIHLNASDDRGIDIIRNQICSFVSSSGMFCTGLKFVILDEIDYMTKNAQHALRYLLINNMQNVRFCLMCNYISKIDEGLQNNFLKLRFNQLPAADIFQFLKNIVTHEVIPIDDSTIQAIQTFYKSDIRSMINFIQMNQDFIISTTAAASSQPAKKLKKKNMFSVQIPHLVQIIDDTIWATLLEKIRQAAAPEADEQTVLDPLVEFVYSLSLKYNMDVKTLLKLLLHYIIRNRNPDAAFLSAMESVMHTESLNAEIYLKYTLMEIYKADLIKI